MILYVILTHALEEPVGPQRVLPLVNLELLKFHLIDMIRFFRNLLAKDNVSQVSIFSSNLRAKTLNVMFVNKLDGAKTNTLKSFTTSTY